MLSASNNQLLTETRRGTPMGDYLRQFWTPALLASELPKPDCPPVRVRLMGEDLVAFRATDGSVGLVQGACPHRRASLFWGRNEENGLRCVYHGWKYDVTGQCVDMPSEPEESNFKAKIRITAYPTIDRGGVIWAYLGPSDMTPELPAHDWLDLPDTHRYVTKRIEMTNWAQALEGGIDSSHSNFLHARMEVYLRDPAWVERAANAPDMRTRYHSLDRSPKFYSTYTDYGLRIGARRDAGDDGHYWRFTHWLEPYYNLFRHPQARPGSNGASFAWVPIDDHRSWTFVFNWNTDHALSEQDIASANNFAGPQIEGTFYPARNADNDYLIDRDAQKVETFSGIVGTQAQDMAVQESMGSIVDRTLEHLGTSDTAIIMVRRQLMRHAMAATEGTVPYAAYHRDVYRTRFADVVVPKEDDFGDEAQRALCSLEETSPI
jgi:phthalate 4,5-dioxygenase oxygenase subunit